MKLTDTQRSLLEAAAKHPQQMLTDFPANLKGGALIKVLTAHNTTTSIPLNVTPRSSTVVLTNTFARR